MPFYPYQQSIPEKFRENAERRVAYTAGLMMVIFDFSGGPQTELDAPHAHPHAQTSYVAEGEIIFQLDGQSERLSAGDMVVIPAGVPHAIQLLSENVRLIDSFSPIREDFIQPPDLSA